MAPDATSSPNWRCSARHRDAKAAKARPARPRGSTSVARRTRRCAAASARSSGVKGAARNAPLTKSVSARRR
eukprot:5079439-Alexandrium_andersonii.AAC.1